jgi:hypothetical protein
MNDSKVTLFESFAAVTWQMAASIADPVLAWPVEWVFLIGFCGMAMWLVGRRLGKVVKPLQSVHPGPATPSARASPLRGCARKLGTDARRFATIYP